MLHVTQYRSRTEFGERLQSARYPDSLYNLPRSIPNTASKASPHQNLASQKYAVHSDTQGFSQSQAVPMLDFARFVAHKELVLTRLNKFDDNPENFRAWESLFVNSQQVKS